MREANQAAELIKGRGTVSKVRFTVIYVVFQFEQAEEVILQVMSDEKSASILAPLFQGIKSSLRNNVCQRICRLSGIPWTLQPYAEHVKRSVQNSHAASAQRNQRRHRSNAACVLGTGVEIALTRHLSSLGIECPSPCFVDNVPIQS